MTRDQSYSKAFENQRNILNHKKSVFETALQNLQSENPDFAKINARLSQLGALLATVAITGDSAAVKKMQTEMSELTAARAEILKQASIGSIMYDCDK